MRRYVLFSAMAALVFLAFTCEARASDISFVGPRIGIASGKGFCNGGAFPRTSWSEAPPPGIRTWGSYCSDRESSTGMMVTSPFVASRSLWLYLAGYVFNPGLSLRIERISDHAKFIIRPPRDPHEEWRLSEFSLPESWRGSLVRLIATDQNTGAGGWLAFSEPVNVKKNGSAALLIASVTLFHFILLLLPALAICAWVVHRGVRNTVTAGLVLLTSIGTVGYLVFWCYFIHPRFGYIAAFVLPVSAAAFLIWLLRKSDSSARQVFKSLIAPVALTAATALLVLSMGFLYGGMQDPFRTASARFSHHLPPDNTIPYLVARGLMQGYVPKPLFMDWLTSDRPPLQSGIVLSQEPFGHPREVGYTVISVIAQSLWVLGLWLLLLACRLERRLIVLVLITCLFSGFVFLNSFFVWPKLLAAAFTLGFFAVLFDQEIGFGSRERRVRFAAAGALLALGMLSHGGTAFATFGGVLAFIALRRRLPLAGIALMAGMAAGVYLPWVLYQKFVDPPGNRLLKMHLAGVEPIDNRSFSEALVSAYRGLTGRQIIDYKLANAKVSLGGGPDWDYWRGIGRIAVDVLKGDNAGALKLASYRRVGMFYSFVGSLGILPFAIFALIAGLKRRFRTVEWRSSGIFFLVVAFSLLGWWIIMFGPGTTVVHQGAYALNLIAAAACILVLWPVSPWLTVAVCALQVILNFVLYVVLMRGFIPGELLPEGHFHRDFFALSLLALAAVICSSILIANDAHGDSFWAAEPDGRIEAVTRAESGGATLTNM